MTQAAFPQPPLAETVSAAARAQLAPMIAAGTGPDMSVEAMRAFATQVQQALGAVRQGRYGVATRDGEMAGVPVLRVAAGAADPDGPLLINLHGGGFVVDSGSATETIPIAGLTGLPVVAVRYRLAPEHPFPAAVDDALAVYRAALERRDSARIAIFGTSAGAVLTMQLLTRLRREGLPLPAAAGIFSGSGDLARVGDCEAYLPQLSPGRSLAQVMAPYVGNADPRDPALSPIFGDLAGLPPMLLMASTRDQLLSHTVMLHQALLSAGVAAELQVFEGMTHAFWSYVDAPETDAALAAQAAFLARHVTR